MDLLYFPLSHPRGVYFLNKQHELTSTIARRREIASFLPNPSDERCDDDRTTEKK